MSDFPGDAPTDALPDPEDVAETLLDAAATGAFDRELARIRAVIAERQDAVEPLGLFRYHVLFFDLALVSTTDPHIQLETAVDLLSGALSAGGPAWDAIRSSSRLDDIERLALEAESGLELLELLAYAPDAGIRSFATSHIEAAGLRALDLGEDSRRFERLLHAVGATPDAYRLESERKRRQSSVPSKSEQQAPVDTAPPYRTIAIAGGHAQLRGTAAELLRRYGIETVQIPSSREAVLRERDISQLVRGCDLVLVLVREITHSTSDQVRKAAERLSIPVAFSNALSAVAIERQLFDGNR